MFSNGSKNNSGSVLGVPRRSRRSSRKQQGGEGLSTTETGQNEQKLHIRTETALEERAATAQEQQTMKKTMKSIQVGCGCENESNMNRKEIAEMGWGECRGTSGKEGSTRSAQESRRGENAQTFLYGSVVDHDVKQFQKGPVKTMKNDFTPFSQTVAAKR